MLKLPTLNKPTPYSFPKLLELVKPEIKLSLPYPKKGQFDVSALCPQQSCLPQIWEAVLAA
jgi:hypothetical protein